jgi:hypothetical protein
MYGLADPIHKTIPLFNSINCNVFLRLMQLRGLILPESLCPMQEKAGMMSYLRPHILKGGQNTAQFKPLMTARVVVHNPIRSFF